MGNHQRYRGEGSTHDGALDADWVDADIDAIADAVADAIASSRAAATDPGLARRIYAEARAAHDEYRQGFPRRTR